MSLRRKRLFAVVLCVCGVAGLVAYTTSDGMGRDQLRVIVQQQCLPHWLQSHDPSPCVSVNTAGNGSVDDGYAVLHDQKGGAHFLLIPTRTIRGIESAEVRTPGAPNYFEAAWKARGALTAVMGRRLPRSMVGLAVNSVHTRSQDQLHIHISCLRPFVYHALLAQASRIRDSWSVIRIGLWHYQAMRIMGGQLGATNPFALVANRLPSATGAMAHYTLLVAGAQFDEGPGFVVLAGTAQPAAELLLDSSCAASKLSPDLIG
ncbi:MAG: CDP-diacylglycerol diphosphatase [Steroidobacteraceae bacterium]